MSSLVPESAPRPKLCHLRKWPDFNGYGFNLHAEKGKAGQYIGKIDEGSPAEVCNLKEGDRIIEVNATNIGNENHQQVVTRIKAVPDETKLLVVEREADDYYKEKKIVVRGDMPNVMVYTCPATRGTAEISSPAQAAASTPASETPASEPEPQAAEQIVASSNEEVDTSRYHPRLCQIKLWPDFQGYGFNLHAEKGKPGQFIGKVDEGSPSELGGLKEGDRIVEVNGNPVSARSHGEVVQHIKSNPNQANLLVVDPDTDQQYQASGVEINGSLPEVETITCPDRSSARRTSVRIRKISYEDFVAEHKISEERRKSQMIAILDSEGRSTPSTAPVSPTPSAADSQSYSARLCHVRIWPDFQGYGFNMHAEKGKPGQYIGKVDDGSPAEAAGLREGDRILEVNSLNVEQDSHQGVVQKIKSVPNETKLLVVETEADNYFKGKGIALSSSSPYVNTITCPERSGGAAPADAAPAAVPVAAAVVATSMAAAPDSHPYSARLCVLRIWPDFQGYGFNMHAEKGKPGQYIGKVDDGSPAEAAGLREGDRIIEVNGLNVEQDSHQGVVQKIKSVANETQLLVLDTDADNYFKSKSLEVNSGSAFITTITCPERSVQVNGEVNHTAQEEEVVEQVSQVPEPEPEPEVVNHVNEQVSEPEAPAKAVEDPIVEATPAPIVEQQHESSKPEEELLNGADQEAEDIAASIVATANEVERQDREDDHEPELVYNNDDADDEHDDVTDNEDQIVPASRDDVEHVNEDYPEPDQEDYPQNNNEIKDEEPPRSESPEEIAAKSEPTPAPEPSRPAVEPTTPTSPVVIDGIEFAATAKEARERMSRKKKSDPRQSTISMKDKYDLFQKL